MTTNGISSRPCVGVVMLNTAFPRFHGDIGNPASFDSMGVDVRYKVVDTATVGEVITASGINNSVTDALLEAIHDFSKEGVDLILTSCGFLSELQTRFQRASSVPVVASSLELLPMLQRAYGDNEVMGVMTYDSLRLNSKNLGMIPDTKFSPASDASAVSEYDNLIVRGMQNACAFYTMIAESKTQVDYDVLTVEVCREAEKFNNHNHRGQKQISALVLECTNLSPFRQEIRRIVNVPVFDILDAARLFLSGIHSGSN